MLFKPYFRLACSNYSDRMSRAAAELSQRDVCPFDSAGFEQRFGGPLPKWTLLSQLEMWSISQAWSRVRRLLMDLELTEKILRVRQLQTESKQKTWPREIPGIETSICSEAHWVYRVAPDETMTLALDRNIEGLDVGSGLTLPLSHSEKLEPVRVTSPQ